MAAITGPIALYNNLPIEPYFYIPRRNVIENIVLGNPTIVQTVSNSYYVIGQEVRFIIPSSFGTRQLNNVKGFVIEILNPTSFVVNVDSKDFDLFVLSTEPTKAQILAVGDVNNGIVNSTPYQQNPFIEGSFKNVSPQRLL